MKPGSLRRLCRGKIFSRYVAANAAHFIVFALCARDEFSPGRAAASRLASQ
jgi:hypothetical protein